MKKNIAILILFFSISFTEEKLNLLEINNNNSKNIPLSKDKINAIIDFVDYDQRVESIYDLLVIDALDIEDIHLLKDYIYIDWSQEEKTSSNFFSYKVDRWLSSEGNSEGLSEIWLDRFFYPDNINNMNFDQINSLPNLSPMDVAAIMKQQRRGKIRGTFELKNSPGISYYGYKNLIDFVKFDEEVSKKMNFRYSSLIRSTPSTNSFEDDEVAMNYDINSNPEMLHRFFFSYNLPDIKFLSDKVNVGILRYNNLNDPANIYSSKKYISFDKINLSGNNKWLRLDKVVLGNFTASYGQGLVFESSDYFQPRRSGYKFTKRLDGIYPDNTRSSQYVLDGIGVQMSGKYFRISSFYSESLRDAVINEDGSFSALILMQPRLGNGYYNNADNKIFENMVGSVIEQTRGGNIRFSPNIETNFGVTLYESLYNRELDPQIINTIVGGSDDDIPQLDADDYDDYSGDVYYLNYMSNSADSEIAAMYSSTGESDLWNKAKSFRRVSGFDFNTVINNLSFQFEYAELNNNDRKLFKFGDGDPSALVLNSYIQFDNFDLLVVHRDYDLEFDNPYQRSFAEYRRYKSSIFEDIYWLEDPMYYHLYSSNPQPQAEKGTYLESRFQFHENFVGGIQWDSWTRKADNAKYYRIVSKLEWRPLFNYRVYFRYKWQARGALDLQHPSPYFTKEARIRFKIRLSNFDNIELLYAWNHTTFSPKPRLAEDANQFADDMTIGDIGSPDESIGFSLEHNYSENLKIKGGVVYVNGFMWYIEGNDFRLFNTESGLMNSWISLNYKPNSLLSLSLKMSQSSDYPTTTIINGATYNGNYIENPYVHKQTLNYRIQLDYAL